MQGMNDSEDAALWYALYRLETSYWFEVDFNAGCNAHEFYVDDGLFAVGDNRFQGQDRIRAFYVWRQQRGHTTTRHLISNLQVARIVVEALRRIDPQLPPPEAGLSELEID